MPIRSSTARDVERLVAELCHGPSMAREAAIARLRVIGGRALERLAHTLAAHETPPAARVAVLRALEGIEDDRTQALGIAALSDPEPEVVIAAIGVLGQWVAREPGTAVLDALTALTLDGTRAPSIRVAALDTLSQLPLDLVRPLLQQAPATTFEAALGDALSAREWLAVHRDAPFSHLYRVVAEARERERRDGDPRDRREWLVTRGVAHALLAQRGSLVSLYDLRETFDAATGPLPLDFLTAVASVGDPSCLEPLARAWTASPEDVWWRDRVAEAASDIARRHHLTGRHGIVRKIRTKWPGFL